VEDMVDLESFAYDKKIIFVASPTPSWAMPHKFFFLSKTNLMSPLPVNSTKLTLIPFN
jgi:hypothetical protein